ncbi:hypothetical protein [Deefgea salmonis]|uniref:Uncharacterized protein n=1 Tax=Deefgea salmonis TaxID=2875502 RepID=A0ABS8BIZ9_9NEIS|nr:hypothetical protein [Deefgea salmonis]MCB5195694.1 hypothetical protein [Deefgea salmonis]
MKQSSFYIKNNICLKQGLASALIGALLTTGCGGGGSSPTAVAIPTATPIQTPTPTATAWPTTNPVPASVGVDKSYYTKYLDAGGIAIVANGSVSDEALWRMQAIVLKMTAKRPDIRKVLAEKIHVSIIPKNAELTSIPEYINLSANNPGVDWNARARGLGPNNILPLMSCGEENIIRSIENRYPNEDICVHEFAHAIMYPAMNTVIPNSEQIIVDLWNKAVATGAFANTYAITNQNEYFATAVQDWYNVNECKKVPDGNHGPVCTNETLKIADPSMYDFLSSLFNNP